MVIQFRLLIQHISTGPLKQKMVSGTPKENMSKTRLKPRVKTERNPRSSAHPPQRQSHDGIRGASDKPKPAKPTVPNRNGFDMSSLNAHQKGLDNKITNSVTGIHIHNASLSRELFEMYDTFVEREWVKRGGPGSQWTAYLGVKGIAKTTDHSLRERAKRRDEAGISKEHELQLARVGLDLDKPKVNEAIIALREKVRGIKSVEDAEKLKPTIVEMSANKGVSKTTNTSPLQPLSPDQKRALAIIQAVREFANHTPHDVKALTEVLGQALAVANITEEITVTPAKKVEGWAVTGTAMRFPMAVENSQPQVERMV
jgi:hypothetical protein